MINTQQAIAQMMGQSPQQQSQQNNQVVYNDLPDHLKNQMHPPKIWETLNLVQSDLSQLGIAKTGFNSHQKYQYRSIDEVFNVLSGVLAKRKLNIRTITDPTHSKIEYYQDSKGTTNPTHSKIEYSQDSKGTTKVRALLYLIFVFTAEDGSCTDARFYVEGNDSSDKASNKAYSAGYKLMASHVFSIPFVSVESQYDNVDSEDDRHEISVNTTVVPDYELDDASAEHLSMMKDNLKCKNLRGAAECAILCGISINTLMKDGVFTIEEASSIRSPEFKQIMMDLKSK